MDAHRAVGADLVAPAPLGPRPVRNRTGALPCPAAGNRTHVGRGPAAKMSPRRGPDAACGPEPHAAAVSSEPKPAMGDRRESDRDTTVAGWHSIHYSMAYTTVNGRDGGFGMSSEQRSAKRTPPQPTLQLGETIRDRREKRRLSMQAVADRAGISAGYQFKLEGGFVRTPSPRVLHRLSAVLDLPYAELMTLAGYPDDAAPAVPSSPSGEVRDDGTDAGAQALDAIATDPAPTNRRIIRLLEEIRRDVAGLREDLRRLDSTQRGNG